MTQKCCPQAINNDFGDIFLIFHKMSNLKMNTPIDFQFFFGKRYGLSEKFKTKGPLLSPQCECSYD